MESIIITQMQLTPVELQKMMDNSFEKALRKLKEEEQRPSDYEEITLYQAAQELHCSERTISRRLKKLNIQLCKTGKKITFQRKWLKKVKQAS